MVPFDKPRATLKMMRDWVFDVDSEGVMWRPRS